MAEHEMGNVQKKHATVLAVEKRGDSDSAQLARLGKTQVLRRDFGFIAMVGFSCTVMISWEAALFTFGIGYNAGGYAGSFWGYVIVWLGNMSAFATMAELASMAPTAAGQYHWVAMLAPSSSRKFLSYIIGWLTVTGWFAVVSGVCLLGTQMLQGMALMTHSDYVIQQWQVPLIYWLVLIVGLFFNTVAVRFLPQVEGLVLILHVLGFFAILIPIAVYGTRGDAYTVFTTWSSTTNWPTEGVSLLVGLVGPAFGLLGGDAAVHMSEEIKKPALNVPRAMMAAVAINGALGLSMLIVQLLYLGDPDSLFATPYATALNFPYIALFQRIVGANAGAVTMVALVFVLVMCAAVSCIATASRLTWAFARDRGLPGWSIWSRVERRTTVPLFSVALVAMAAVGLSLIGFGSAIAFNIMISLTVAHLYTSYFIGNALLLYRRIAGQIEPYSPDETDIVNTIGAARLTWGPWKVPGVLGIINNIVGCIFLLVVLFFSFFPTVNNPTPQTMNWSVLLAVGIASLALVYYIIVGRKTFKGPIVETVGDGY